MNTPSTVFGWHTHICAPELICKENKLLSHCWHQVLAQLWYGFKDNQLRLEEVGKNKLFPIAIDADEILDPFFNYKFRLIKNTVLG